MSAFAARQQLWATTAVAKNNNVEKKATPEPVLENPRSAQLRKSETPSARSVVGRRTKRQSPEAPVVADAKQAQGLEIGAAGSGPSTPGLESNGILVRHHSSFKPNKKNLQRKPGGRIVLVASEGERLVVLGSFGIKVREGEATFAGAILTSSDPVQWVHAPHCHAVAVLRTADDTVLELQPHPAAKGLRQLAALNPAFAKLWNESPQATSSKSQPEYSPPGVISLFNITIPNLSPPFCHPTLTPAEGQLRAHAIASVTPGLDPAHYIECVLDLLMHYQRHSDPKPPLVVNTPGWVQGTGLDILSELIMAVRPTEVIYMSQDGPEETVNSLQEACTATTPPTPFSMLPSQPSEASSTRTSLHFRTMQTIRRPELLAEAINGTILALVKLEDRAALGCWTPRGVVDGVLGLHDGGGGGGETAAKGLVLVAGRFDTPTWAYGEDLYLRGVGRGGGVGSVGLEGGEDGDGDGYGDDGGEDDSEDESEGEGEGDSGDESESGDGGDVGAEREAGGRKSRRMVGEVPWVEMLHGSQRRAVGSKVWRVRRDLGKN
ncbi:hypothetical protein CHGG_09674 [Chaetomium globosum CBS 148.51]|uniref:Polynucleotide 5'-hydroxyl-kinase GRC3 n=1 Tax=Chaetomium globosum (strain ATCC 6205 / CBS 148.51 / DSM 1962 / NBRC 6347 / NRRL 1970) TaxID=306901 RepID=Q2GQT0_CHAGB|nr:uncharacterized protein CHGG_09674 [Chaetomium globosum CBS 148.51]EAQ83270.1 hypothetical protein CHGG_09674 [Chaetomium globosum CBS 148.51]